jgi:hypothetical protein
MKKIELDDPLAQEYLKEHNRLLNKIFSEPEQPSKFHAPAERTGQPKEKERWRLLGIRLDRAYRFEQAQKFLGLPDQGNFHQTHLFPPSTTVSKQRGPEQLRLF